MYSSFFGLNEKPFSITPDPRYLYMSQRHTEALAHLIYGVKESGGFIQLTGEVGTGKTTLVRSLLQQLPESADVALVLNSQLSKTEFLDAICEELGTPTPHPPGSIKALTDALNDYLLENHSNGRRTILIVDEAQNLQPDVLEQVRLLTNLETTKQKLLQIILIGQPELRELLARNDMRQLAQRITGRYHLEPLTLEETTAYIDHRLKVAGCSQPVFSMAAKKAIYRLSKGIPRIINVVADRALLGAFTKDMHEVTPALVRDAAEEIYGHRTRKKSPAPRRARYAAMALGGAALVVALALGFAGYPRLSQWMNGTANGHTVVTPASDQSRTTTPPINDRRRLAAANGATERTAPEPLNAKPATPAMNDSGATDSWTGSAGVTNPRTTGTAASGTEMIDPGVMDPGTMDSGAIDSGMIDSGTTGSGTTSSGTIAAPVDPETTHAGTTGFVTGNGGASSGMPAGTGAIGARPIDPAPASLEALLQEKRQQTGNDSAFQTLFGLWNAAFTPGPVRACDQAIQHNLYCLSQRGSLAQIRVLDRPAILTLRDARGDRHQVVLSSLAGSVATVRIGNQRYEVGTAELADLWFGEYLLLWRPGIGSRKALLPGMQDQDVRWLRESLATIRGTPLAPVVSDLYDQELENQVRDYQRKRRLTVDGLVGQQTQIAINTDLNPTGVPRLVRVN